MSSLDPGTRTGYEEALNAPVPETSNHFAIVACGATSRKFCEPLTGGSNPWYHQNLTYFDSSKLSQRPLLGPPSRPLSVQLMAFYLPAPVESSPQADALSVFAHSQTIGFYQQRLDGLERDGTWIEYGNP